MDDILIRKYVPGQVTVQGNLSYTDRNGNLTPASFTKVSLYDHDPGGTDIQLITTPTFTKADGSFEFPEIVNWDGDDTDPDLNHRRLDLYVIWETDGTNDSISSHRLVTNFNNQDYRWASEYRTDVPDGDVSFSAYNVGNTNLGAMWILQDIRHAWEKIYNNTSPHIDPGPVTAWWEPGINCDPRPPYICNHSFFWAGDYGPYIFIDPGNLFSADAVVHEAGHFYMYNATDYWTWWDVTCYNHTMFYPEDGNCAWTEGWGDFLALIVNNDPCYDWGIGPCGGGPSENIENHNLNDPLPNGLDSDYYRGETVEGRVAGALYDLWDPANDPPYDSATFGLGPIAKITLQGSPEYTFEAFWESWRTSSQNKHQAVRAIYQNTIDYDTAPRFNQLLPDRTVFQNSTWTHAIDLWNYTEDDDSADTELIYQVISVSPASCGVSLDSHWINLAPQANWLGSCDVTVSVSDTIMTPDDSFVVNVVLVGGRVYLPLVLNQ